AENISRTFHGRDIFAPVAAHLSAGVKPNEFGREIEDFIQFETAKPKKISGGNIEAEIIHIDRFGNLVTNLRKKDLPEKFSIEINGKLIDRLQNFYVESKRGELFIIFGSAGFLEIAASQNSASKLLNATVGERVLVSIVKPKKSA
ncbi:MAG: SAM-dependent chlorinase/fluorinase, partial [Pyrinomonadaceae bacterium]